MSHHSPSGARQATLPPVARPSSYPAGRPGKRPPRPHTSRGDGRVVKRIAATIVVVLLAGVALPRSTTLPRPGLYPPTARTGVPFSPTSFWNTPLPDDAPADPRSPALVSGFNVQWRTFYGTVGINTGNYSVSTYTVPADVPTVKVALGRRCNRDASIERQLAAVPIPEGAQPAPGRDASLIIWQPSSDTAWELWGAGQLADGWAACWGGRIQRVSRSNGVFPVPYGVAASGLSYLAGAIKVWELRSGEIRHALAVNMVHTTAGTQTPPATRNDGNSTEPDAIPEGTRFRLDPTIDVTTLGLTPTGEVVARALQRYGMVVTDTAGAVVLMAEGAAPYVAAGKLNPYVTLFGSKPPHAVLEGIPWERMSVVDPSVSTNGG